MQLYPAIDLKGGKCVRLRQGLFSDVKTYSDNPAEMARRFASEGATFLHVVDLDGAHMGFADIDKELQTVRDELKMSIHMQRMDIFDAMHRI